jgi:hypothetical protein
MSNPELTTEQKRELVDALLKCLAMQDQRDEIVNQLPDDIKNGIPRDKSPKPDVMHILEHCVNYDNGLQSLFDALKFLEGDSKSVRMVQLLISQYRGQEENKAVLKNRTFWLLVGMGLIFISIFLSIFLVRTLILPDAAPTLTLFNKNTITPPAALQVTEMTPSLTVLPIQTRQPDSPSTVTPFAVSTNTLTPDFPPSPSATIAQHPAATILSITPLSFNNIIAECRDNKFTQDGTINPVTCASSERPDAMQLSWRVLTKGSYAGCSVPISSAAQESIAVNDALAFWVNGEPGKKFLIGFTTPDRPNGWKVIVEVNESGWHQQFIPLSQFTDQGADLAKVERLVIAFEYTLGEGSLTGTLCFDEFGFGQH